MSLADALASGPSEPEQPAPRLQVDAGPDGGEFTGLVTNAPVRAGEYKGAFARVFELAGLDPEEYRIVDDTVRFSSWQQSARAKDGHRDLVTLYSYRARFERITVADREVEDLPALMRIAKANARRRPRPKPAPLTRVVGIADAQIGKTGRRGGTPELLERYAVLLERLDELMVAQPCEDAVVVDPGDVAEGFQNYKGQRFLNDLSHPSQLRVARGLVTDGVTTVAARHAHTRVLAVPSNHTGWREGKEYLGKPGDDYGLDVHHAVAEALSRDPRFRDVVEWVFPGEWEVSLAVPVRGAVLGVTHGHEGTTRPEQIPEWWRKQSHGRQPVSPATILVTGHYHHLRIQPVGNDDAGRSRWWFQLPTLDNGSDQYRHTAGEDSEPGIFTFTIDDAGRWDHPRLLTI